MINITSNRFLSSLAKKKINLETDVLKLALMTSSYSPDRDNNVFNDTEEVTGVGYTAGGVTITNSVVTQDDTDNRMTWDVDDVLWPGSTIICRYAVMYDVTAGNEILFTLDFVSDKVSVVGLFAVRWPDVGLLEFLQG